jgi:hypothetical protein
LPSGFPDLEEVALSDILISTLDPECILAPQLRKLMLEDEFDNYSHNISSDLDILCTNNLTLGSASLYHLELRGMGLTSRISRNLSQLPNLEILDILHRGITPEFVIDLY